MIGTRARLPRACPAPPKGLPPPREGGLLRRRRAAAGLLCPLRGGHLPGVAGPAPRRRARAHSAARGASRARQGQWTGAWLDGARRRSMGPGGSGRDLRLAAALPPHPTAQPSAQPRRAHTCTTAAPPHPTPPHPTPPHPTPPHPTPPHPTQSTPRSCPTGPTPSSSASPSSGAASSSASSSGGPPGGGGPACNTAAGGARPPPPEPRAQPQSLPRRAATLCRLRPPPRRRRSLANETVTVDEAKAVYPFMAIGANIALVCPGESVCVCGGGGGLRRNRCLGTTALPLSAAPPVLLPPAAPILTPPRAPPRPVPRPAPPRPAPPRPAPPRPAPPRPAPARQVAGGCFIRAVNGALPPGSPLLGMRVLVGSVLVMSVAMFAAKVGGIGAGPWGCGGLRLAMGVAALAAALTAPPPAAPPPRPSSTPASSSPRGGARPRPSPPRPLRPPATATRRARRPRRGPRSRPARRRRPRGRSLRTSQSSRAARRSATSRCW
jgi:hypothetical protein